MGARSIGSGRRFVLGTDIGGTFTDFVGAAEGENSLFLHKSLTTPEDPTEAIFTAIDLFEAGYCIGPQDSLTVVHATTLATNLILEGKGAKAALITTSGFRDILTMRRENRYDDYDFKLAYPAPLVPRSLRFEIDERTLACGKVLRSPGESELREIASLIQSENVEAIAVCLLHAYANPANEQRVRQLLMEAGCLVPISISSHVQSEIREYERCSTTVVNAYVQPAVLSYVARFEQRLMRKPYRTQLFIMQSNGGYADGKISGEVPARLVESGPAAGAIAAGYFSAQAQAARTIAFDMGGTTAKVATIRDYSPEISSELEVARKHRLKKGSGIPLRCPSVELIEIGSGGGSVAYLDDLVGLRVGPDSAGSMPGPACYDRGGTRPTVTDADLVLGYLDADSFPFPLSRENSWNAISKNIAEPLNVETIDAAAGIMEMVTEQMASATRIHLIEKGLDPRDFTLIAFGGAGPVHACFMARRLGIRTIIYPVAAGVASAFGLLIAPNTSVATRTFIQKLETADLQGLKEVIAQLQRETIQQMHREESKPAEATYTLFLEMRYAKQGYDILVAIPDYWEKELTVDRIRQLFSDTYKRTFGRLVEEVPIEIASVRLFAKCRSFASISERAISDRCASDQSGGRKRSLYLKESGGFVDCDVLDRAALKNNGATRGPLIIEDPETTIVVDANTIVRVDEFGHVIAELK